MARVLLTGVGSQDFRMPRPYYIYVVGRKACRNATRRLLVSSARIGRRRRDGVAFQAREGSRAGVLTVASSSTTAAAAQPEPNQNGAGGAIRLHIKPAITEAGRIINP